MKFKKPTKVQIGSLTYKIKYIKAGASKWLAKRETGAIDQHNMTIYIDSDSPEQIQMLSLMHEILHGMAFIICPTASNKFREHLATAGAELLLQALQSSGLLS